MINPKLLQKKMSILRISILSIFVLSSLLSQAEIKLPRLISNGMVLQRDTELRLWGWASPGEHVNLEFKGAKYEATTSDEGIWGITLPTQEKGGPYKLKFSGENEITIENVVFGDVWVCSGQSNMELWMGRVKEKYLDVIAESENPMIRQYLVPDKYDFKRLHDDLDGGEWIEANPETILNFSAVAYFFARELYDQYQVPIGLINAALGGSPIEAWMSEETLKQFPASFSEMQRFKDDQLIQAIETADRQKSSSWYKVLNEFDQGLAANPQWSKQGVDDRDWNTVDIPGYWTEDASNGVYWFRRELQIPAKHIGKPASLWLGRIVDQDYAYLNGKLVGTTGYQYPPRRYTIDSLILEKRNTISIRVISQSSRGEFVPDKPYYLAVDGDTFDISGEWNYKLGASMRPMEGQTFVRWKPGGLYNRMISPLTSYKIRGVIWYQGESNAGQPETYHEAFSAMINNWRDVWNQDEEFPFLYVQLANFMEETDKPVESDWAELRQAQLETLSIQNTGMVVAIDLGEWNDIHPLNKKDVGHRLALLAKMLAYKEDKILISSPIPDKVKYFDNHVMIHFNSSSGKLKTRNNEPVKYVSVSNDGVNFFWAEVEIIGSSIKVWNDNVSKPSVVRYAWSDNPASANLVSEVGLPVSPFEVRKD